MKRELIHFVVFSSLLAGSLGCSFSVNLGSPTPTPSSIPYTSTPEQLPSPSPTATLLPTVGSPTAEPTATPLPPPEVISLQNIDRLNVTRPFGMGGLSKVQVSPDGATVLLAYSAKLVMLKMSDLRVIWEVETDRILSDITFSKDGSQLISSAFGGTVQIRDAATGGLVSTSLTQKEGIFFQALSPSGHLFLLNDYSRTTKMWDTSTGKEAQSNNGQAYPGGINTVLISPDDSVFVIGGIDSKMGPVMQQWKVSDGAYKIALLNVPQEMALWKYSPDGKRIYGLNTQKLTVQPSTELTEWDTYSGRLLKVFSKDDVITDYLPSPDGKSILIATKEKKLKLLEVESGKVRGIFSEHKADIVGMGFSPEGQSVVSVSSDGRVIVWDTLYQKVKLETEGTSSMPFAPIAISEDTSRAVILIPGGKNVGVVDTSTWKVVQPLGSGDIGYSALAISSHGKRVAARDEKNRIHIWDTVSGKETRSFEAQTRFSVRKLKFSHDEMLLSSLSDGQIFVWDAEKGTKIKELAGYKDFEYSPDDKQIASDSVDYRLYLTDVQSGKSLASVAAEDIYTLAFAPGGKIIAVGGQKVQPKERGLINLVYLVDTQSQKRMPVEMKEIDGWLANVAFSPSGDILVSSDWQGNINFWNPRDGTQLKKLEELACPPAALRFNPDGTLLYIGGGDGTIRVLSTTPGVASNTSPTKTSQAEVIKIPEISPDAYAHSKGLLTVKLPIGWKVEENSNMTISASDPGEVGSIQFSGINTLVPLVDKAFEILITDYEKNIAQMGNGYKEIGQKIDSQKGEAFVTKSMKIGNTDLIWDTYYTRDGAMFYQVSFITIKDMAEALLPLYQKVYASLKVNKEFVLKQMPYSDMKKFKDHEGKFVFDVPASWSGGLTSQPGVETTVISSPDEKVYLVSVDIVGEKIVGIGDTQIESLLTQFIGQYTSGGSVLHKEKLSTGDMKMTFDSPSKKKKGTVISSYFGNRLHLFMVEYVSDLEQGFGPLVDYLNSNYKKQ